MALHVFTEQGAAAWWAAINASAAYREAAARWEGSVVFEMADGSDDGGEAVFLDLHHGRCRAARLASAADREEAAYVIAGTAESWQRILAGRLEPFWALTSGKLRLRRGLLAGLAPYARAARELLATAAALDGAPAQRADGEGRASGPAAAPERGDAGNGDGRARTYRTAETGLDWDSPPMRLWRKAKRLGTWNPEAIDFRRDREDWGRLDGLEREVILHLTAAFQAGEESVTLDLLPLVQVIAAEGRLEEEMFLTAFLFEEAKHVELFRRFLDGVPGGGGDLTRFYGPAYAAVFGEALPRAIERLGEDPSPEAQAEASVTYNMIVEGVLAETGYHAYHATLERHDILPGMRRAVAHVKADEARHLAYGVHLLSRLVAEHGEPVWERIETKMSELLPLALGVIEEVFGAYETMPFGLRLEDFTEFATTQFERRVRRIEQARRGLPEPGPGHPP